MKKNLLNTNLKQAIMRSIITAILIISSMVVVAQPKIQPDTTKWTDWDALRIGVEAGVGLNSVSSSNVTQKLQLNESAGVFINYSGGGFMLESGLRWYRRNLNLTNFNSEYTTTVNRLSASVNYLEVPLMIGGLLQVNNSKKTDIKLGLKLGIYFAAGLCGSGTLYGVDANSVPYENKISNTFKNENLANSSFDCFNRFDMGGKLGIDIYVNRFKFGFMYTRGWVDINKSYDRHIKTKSFDFTIGYSFIFSKIYNPVTFKHNKSKGASKK